MEKLKKLTVICFITVLLFCGCQKIQDSEAKTSISSVASAQDASKSMSDELSNDEVASTQEDFACAPELIGVTKQDVDFLSSEQWELLEKGEACVRSFELSSGCFYGAPPPANPPKKMINGLSYQRYVGPQYGGWNDFYNDMLTVFTPQYFAELNLSDYGLAGKADTYINLEEDLYYVSANRGANPAYLKKLDRYELIEANEERIEFNLIAYYLSHSDVGTNRETAESKEHCPVVLENTQNGWRISKMTLPY